MNNSKERFEELLARLLDGESDGDERSELARLCSADQKRGAEVREALFFAESLRQAFISGGKDVFEADLTEQLNVAALGNNDFKRLRQQVVDGGSLEQDTLSFDLRSLQDQPAEVRKLRNELEFDELLTQAVSTSKSEEAFVQSLSTRMWAEVEEDHFVDDLSSKIIEWDAHLPVADAEPVSSNREVSISLSDTVSLTQQAARPGKVWSILFKPALAAAAAVVLTGLVLWNVQPESRPASLFSPQWAQVVAEGGDVVWRAQEGRIPDSKGGLVKGVYHLESGTVHLRFREGAEMALEGPAEFEIKGKRTVNVLSGLAVTRSNAGNKRNFIFETKGLNLDGSGSTLGIDVRDDKEAELVVLSGDAEIQLQDSAEGEKRRLYHFEAVRADLDRDKLVDIPFNSRPFSKAWELMSGVAAPTGTVEVAVPGHQSKRVAENNRVRVTVERDQFKLADNEQLEVDTLSKGHFVSMNGSKNGEVLTEKGHLRSYLLEFKPGKDGKLESTLEASMTFDHPVVGVIFSEDRLVNSADLLGRSGEPNNESMASGQLLLSDDGRTVNLLLTSEGNRPVSGTVRVLVALN